MKTIFDYCVDDTTLDIAKLDEIIEELSVANSTFWYCAEEYMVFASMGSTVTWLERDGDHCDLNGSELKPDNLEVIDFNIWFELAMKELKGEK